MNSIIDMIKGIFIGVANIIPGVSGGTMAVSLGVYDKLIAAVSNLFKNWKASVRTLLPLVAGCAVGIVGFTYAIEFLLSRYTFITCMAFVGLILGGLPMLVLSLKGEMRRSSRSIGASGVLAFVLMFCVAVFLPMLGADNEVLRTFSITPMTLISLFVVGVIASATMVIPGVSGSLVMMILGYYYGIINTIKNFLEALRHFDIGGMFHEGILLVPFGIGVLLGIFLIARLITFLFERYGVATYCAILGLIIASPFAIFYNTGLLKSGALLSLSMGEFFLGLALAAAGAVFTFLLGRVEAKKG